MFPWSANMGHSVTSVSTRHKSSVIKWSAWGLMVNGRWNSVWLSLREQAQAFKDQDFSCTISGRLVKKKTGRRAFCGLDVGPNTYDGPCVSPKTLVWAIPSHNDGSAKKFPFCPTSKELYLTAHFLFGEYLLCALSFIEVLYAALPFLAVHFICFVISEPPL